MNLRTLSITSILLMLVAQPLVVFADAIIVSQVMFASTIAEYYVEEDHVRVDLEIGVADLASFWTHAPDMTLERFAI